MNRFSSFHPAALLLYFSSVMVITVFSSNPVIQLLALAGGVMFSVFTLKSNKRAGDIFFYFIMFLLITATNPLFSHNGETILFFMNGNAFTLEAVLYGASLSVTVIAVIMWFKCITNVMTDDKMIFLFGGISPRIALVLSMSLRFVPAFRRRAEKVRRAQRALGVYSEESRAERLRGSLAVYRAMTEWSLESTAETAMSMRARGYGLKGASRFSLFKFGVRDAALIIATVILAAVCFAGMALGAARFGYYPKIAELTFDPLSAAVYVSFGALSFLPFVTEIKEAIAWKYYALKI